MNEPLILDFEARSPLDIKKVGVYRWSEHPRSEIICFFAKHGANQGVFFNPDADVLPAWLLDALEDPSTPIHAHNSTVERLVIKRICGPRHGWPVPKGHRYRCSAARARRMAIPGALDKAGVALSVPIQKDAEGKRVMLRLVKPLKHDPVKGYVYDENPDKLARVGEYCKNDVLAEEAIENATYPLPEKELEYYQMTERLNDRGVKVDVDLVKRLIWRANEALEELNTKLRNITGGAVEAITNVAQLKQWIYDETGTVLETLRKEDMDGLMAEAGRYSFPPHVVRALRLRQEGAKSSVAKLLAILNRVSDDGRIHGAFVYHGASTGRYTSLGVQLQNLVRDTLKNFDEDIKRLEEFSLIEISKCIRGCFIPEKNHVFVDADYNAIEARGVGWLAGAKKLLAIYLRNGDPYCEMGTAIYGFPVTKSHEWERFVGKQTILGCCYGMGGDKFEAQCERFGNPVPAGMGKKAVNTYREEYPEIPELWKDLEWAAVQAVKHPGRVFAIPNGLIKFKSFDGYLRMLLPSGRPLFYKHPKLLKKMTPWGKEVDELSYMAEHPTTKQWVRETTWGGKLTENAVQAISRDLLFIAMKRLETWGINVVLSVHDQIVAEVLSIDAEWAKRKIQQALEMLPEWAKGFPVAAEPKITLRFGK